MLAEERYKIILDCLDEKNSITVTELCDVLHTSESTIRRDLNSLAGMNKLVKVHGGATIISSRFSFEEHSVETKSKLYSEEKIAVAKYAASTINKNDFIFIDSGTTTEKLIDFITEKDITVVTNSFNHAKKLASNGFKTFITGGQLKATTEAIVGADTVMDISRYNFTKAFLGTNGISIERGFTTPDTEEAQIKAAAVRSAFITYVLADHSKFDVVSYVTFAHIDKACIITDKVTKTKYKEKCIIKEVTK